MMSHDTATKCSATVLGAFTDTRYDLHASPYQLRSCAPESENVFVDSDISFSRQVLISYDNGSGKSWSFPSFSEVRGWSEDEGNASKELRGKVGRRQERKGGKGGGGGVGLCLGVPKVDRVWRGSHDSFSSSLSHSTLSNMRYQQT